MAESLKYRVPPGVVTQSIADELVLLNNKTELYYSLDKVGAMMFEALAGGSDTGSVAQLVCEAFGGVEIETVQADVTELVDNLLQRELLEEVR